MERRELSELHYITPLANIPSIFRHGILSHNRAARLPHESVAMPEIQDRRRRRAVPGGMPLHNYANLYICARNPMLYRLLDQHLQLSVLSVHTNVLDLNCTVIADRNASSDYTRFSPAPGGLIHVDKELVFAEYWTHEDVFEEWRHKSIKCAEVLVPDRVPFDYIRGAYVSSENSHAALIEILNREGIELKIKINRHLFFRK